MVLSRQEQMFVGIGAVALLVMMMSKRNGGSKDADVEMMDLPPAGGAQPSQLL